MNKNLLIAVDNLGVVGLERQLIEMVRLLSNFGYTIVISSLHRDRGWDNVLLNQVKEIVYIKRDWKLSFYPVYQYYKIIQTKHISIVHSYSVLSVYWVYPSAKIKRIKLINGCIRHAGVEKGINFLLSYLALTLSDIVISNSKAGLEYYGYWRNAHVIYNFIDRTRFRRNTSTENVMVMVASFSEYKDQWTFLLAAKHLLENLKIDRAILIGDGKWRAKYQEIVKKWDVGHKIEFLGNLTNGVEEVLSTCRIGVLCSTKKYGEGVSNAILEYMGAGLVSFGADVGGTKEIVIDGANGFLFRAEDCCSLIDKIMLIQDRPQIISTIIHNADNSLREKFDAETNIKKLVFIYESCLKH